jgi:hypothetical protein
MKIIRNDKIIARNAKIGQYVTYAVLGLVIVIIYLAITGPSRNASPNETYLLFMLVIIAFILTQASTYLGTRYNRSPRPDEALDAALKGIPGDYSIYHYAMPASHVLVGPAGIWVLLPYFQKGRITYQKNRWKLNGGGFVQGYLRIFGQEGIGRPDLEAESEAALMDKFFKKNLAEGEMTPPIHSVLVFLDPAIEIEAEGAPLPALTGKKLKDHIRKFAKENPFSANELEKVRMALEKE